MRIFISFPYALGRVGVGRTALQQANGLAARGHEVLVCAPILAEGADLEPGVRVVQTRRLLGRRIPARLMRSKWRAMDWHDARAAHALRAWNRKGSVDILHTWPLAGTRTYAAARRLGIPIAREAPNTHTAHGYDVVERETRALGLTLPPGNSHVRDQTHLVREQMEWDAADAILAPSDAVFDSFVEQGFDPVRLVRHRYGCELPPGATPRTGGNPLSALFLGAAEPRKGLHHALDAWLASNASDDGVFVIAGRFMAGYAEALADRLAHPSVRIEGFLADPAEALASADVLLLPSIEEGSAIVSYEAQASGCVPLVSDAAGAHLTSGVQGLVHSAGDVAVLTAQLNAVAASSDLLADMSRASIAHRSELGWSYAAEVLEGAYLAIIDRRQR